MPKGQTRSIFASFTDAERDAFILRYINGCSVKKLAKEYGQSYVTVYRWLAIWEIPTHKKPARSTLPGELSYRRGNGRTYHRDRTSEGRPSTPAPRSFLQAIKSQLPSDLFTGMYDQALGIRRSLPPTTADVVLSDDGRSDIPALQPGKAHLSFDKQLDAAQDKVAESNSRVVRDVINGKLELGSLTKAQTALDEVQVAYNTAKKQIAEVVGVSTKVLVGEPDKAQMMSGRASRSQPVKGFVFQPKGGVIAREV